MGALDSDEHYLDPTQITLLCGAAGYDGTQFKPFLASEHDIQINKTSRNSVLDQINMNNTRSDLAHLIKALADMVRGKSLVEDVPDTRRSVSISGRRRKGTSRNGGHCRRRAGRR